MRKDKGETPLLAVLLVLTIPSSIASLTVGARAQSDEKVVALVDGRRITQKEVDDSIASQLLPLQQQLQALRRKALDNLILRAILEGEAKKRGVSVEELRRQLTAGRVEVPASQVEQLYLENAATFAAMSPDEAKERLRLDLESQARMRNYREALARLKAASAVELLPEGSESLSVGGLDGAPARGPAGASVIIVEFADFQCPYCKTSQATVRRVLQEYGSKVRLVFKHLPLTDVHPQALPAARAAFCAGEQGSFWQYHDALFAAEELSPEAFDKLAARLGLSLPEFTSCLDSESSRAAVIGDVREARRVGIDGVPAFVVNGKLVRGAVSFEEFKAIIERELSPARAIPPSP